MGTMSSADAVHGSAFSWVKGGEIGSGAMGQVFRALNQRTGEVIAVKAMPIDVTSEADLQLRQALENELEICKTLRHPRIVSFLGHDYIEGSLFIYLEYMAGGSVAQVISM